ncbi:MAG: rRNA methyltransferase [Actinobacteria bacterium RBG_16_70_17]|nr:MAG: rRNA methyltransferase [Actinobacteria bacterium RBG_16_70_17]
MQPFSHPEPITSPANPRIKHLVRLRERRERDESALFLIEGYRELSRALEAGVELTELYSCPALYLGEHEGALVEAAIAAGAEVVPVAESPFRKASYRDRPEGLLGVARQFPTGLERLQPGPDPLLLVVEAIEKPGNLGTMLRTAEAAGAAAVVVCDPATDPFNPNVVRASLGTLFSVPVVVGDTPGAITRLRALGIRTVATTPSASLAHWEADLTGPVAVVVGSEQYGLSVAWLEAADLRVVIPMPGSVDSLNAAMAAGVVLFDAVRQRAAADRSARPPSAPN